MGFSQTWGLEMGTGHPFSFITFFEVKNKFIWMAALLSKSSLNNYADIV